MKKSILLAMTVLLALALLCSCSGEKTATPEKGENDTTIGDADMKLDDGCVVGSDYTELLQAQAPKKGDTIVTFETTLGTMRALVYADKAPKAVENFLTHASEGYYDGVIFHRIIPNFMIQTGDPTGTGAGGESIWGGKFETELPDGLYHFRGALAMARTSQMNTNGSQFYIVQNPKISTSENTATGTAAKAYSDFGGYPFLDGQYTVFGQVFQGFDVIDAIAAKGTQSGKPSEEVKVNKITVSIYE